MPRGARDWTAARAKVEQEGRCRVCKDSRYLQAAHVISRTYDPPNGKVRAVDIMPLCARCHQSYDQHALDVLAYLTYEEQAAAVGHVGLDRALSRLTGNHMAIVPIAVARRGFAQNESKVTR